MKKTIIALMTLAGVASATTVWEDTTLPKGGDLYAGAFDFQFVITEDGAVSGDYDVLLAYYQVNGSSYNVNAFELSNVGVLTLNCGGSVSLTDGILTSDSTMGTTDKSTFVDAEGTAYVLSTPGLYTVDYLGGTNGSAAANLYLDGVKVAGFSGGNHNMNGTQQGSDNPPCRDRECSAHTLYPQRQRKWTCLWYPSWNRW